MRDVVVIGAGLAGLAAAIKAADAGLSVTLVTKGVGGIQLGTGTVDILGYRPEPVEKPLEALEGHVASRPTHPYSHVTPTSSVRPSRGCVPSSVRTSSSATRRATCAFPPALARCAPPA